MRWLSLVLLAACAAPAARVRDVADAPIPGDRLRCYAIWLGGAQIGVAHETEQWSARGVIVRRREAMRFLRGDAPVAIDTTIEIEADAALVPSRVTWSEQAQAVRHGEAVRDAAGWTVRDDTAARRLPRGAIPAELAPLVVRRDGQFAGPVFLPARGFIAGAGRIEPIAPGRLIARLAFAGDAAAEATAEATIDLGDDGMPIRVVDGEGVIATRITAAEAARPLVPADLIAATAIALAGAPSHRLLLEGELAVPPVPGQRTRPVADGAVLELSATLAGGLPPGVRGTDRTREIAALVRRVRGRIAPDLAADPTSARTAAAATAGDCTTFALAYSALAAERAIPTLLVTGFRVDGDRLVRHRWAVSWTGSAWIAVDAAFGAVPAGGDLVGLAIHDSDDLGLVAGEAALTHVRAATWQ